MRKVFLDCGAHKATSIKKFREEYPNAGDYEIISFECNPKYLDVEDDVQPGFFAQELKLGISLLSFWLPKFPVEEVAGSHRLQNLLQVL